MSKGRHWAVERAWCWLAHRRHWERKEPHVRSHGRVWSRWICFRCHREWFEADND
jgi:hypothetical protein